VRNHIGNVDSFGLVISICGFLLDQIVRVWKLKNDEKSATTSEQVENVDPQARQIGGVRGPDPHHLRDQGDFEHRNPVNR